MEWKFGGVVSLMLVMLVARASGLSFVSESVNVVVLEGETVVLPCEVNTGGQMVMIAWSKDASMMTFNRDILNPDIAHRVTLEGSGDVYNLVIGDVEVGDEGEYDCQVAGRGLSQQHFVTVNVPASIVKRPDEETIEAKLGEILALNCEAGGKPQPTVTWTRESGELMPNGAASFEGERLEFPPMDKDDADYYLCKADNGQGDPVTEDFEVLVRYPPTSTSDPDFIHTGVGDNVVIECVFDASPAVQVSWEHNSSDINDLERPNIERRQEGQTWTLQITDVQMVDIGDYICSGGNSYGSASSRVVLSGLPHELSVTSNPMGQYSNEYLLHWEVSAFSPPIEYILKHKVVNESMQGEWKEVTIAASGESTGASKHTQEYKFLQLSANGSYMVKLQAKNVFGLSDWTQEFEFFTEDEGHTAPPTTTPKPTTVQDTEKPVVPGGSDSGSSHMISDIICHLVAMVSMMTLTFVLA